MLNKIILMGRLTRDPELRRTQSDLPVTSFTLAVDRRFSKQGEDKQTDFIDIVCWRKDAEFAAKWFSKGMLVAVSGSLQMRPWQDKEGNKRISAEVVAEELHFAESKRSDSTGPRDIGGSSSYGSQASSGYAPLPSADTGRFSEVSDNDEEELPF